MGIAEILVGLAILGAVVYIILKAVKAAKGQDGCGCGCSGKGCGSGDCPSSKGEKSK